MQAYGQMVLKGSEDQAKGHEAPQRSLESHPIPPMLSHVVLPCGSGQRSKNHHCSRGPHPPSHFLQTKDTCCNPEVRSVSSGKLAASLLLIRWQRPGMCSAESEGTLAPAMPCV